MSHASLYRGDLLTLMDAEGMKLPPRIAGKLCGFDYTEEEVDSQGLTTTKPPPVKPSEAKSSSTSARVPARDKRKLQFSIYTNKPADKIRVNK